MSLKYMVLGALIIVGGHFSTASAGTISLDAVHEGEIVKEVEFGFTPSSNTTDYGYSATFDEIGTATFPGAILSDNTLYLGGTFDYRGFYIFDLSSVGFQVTEATLELQLAGPDGQVVSLSGLESTFANGGLLNMSSSSSQSVLSNGFSDIVDGAQYGSTSLTGFGSGFSTFNISLSAAALNFINSTNGLFAVGVSAIGAATPFGAPDLVSGATLNLGSASGSVPVPASLWLVALASILLGRHQRAARKLQPR